MLRQTGKTRTNRVEAMVTMDDDLDGPDEQHKIDHRALALDVVKARRARRSRWFTRGHGRQFGRLWLAIGPSEWFCPFRVRLFESIRITRLALGWNVELQAPFPRRGFYVRLHWSARPSDWISTESKACVITEKPSGGPPSRPGPPPI